MGRNIANYRKQAREQWVKEARQFRLLLRTLLVYFGTLITLVIVVNLSGVEMTAPQTGAPTPWLWLIWFVIYMAPILLAGLYGILFSPFWVSLRNCLVPILVVQLIYSGGILIWRDVHRRGLSQKIYDSRTGHLNVLGFEVNAVDQNQDGLADQVLLKGTVDVASFPPGSYYIHPLVEQSGRVLADEDIEPFRFVRTQMDPQRSRNTKLLLHAVQWAIDPAAWQDYARRGPMQVNLRINRFLPQDFVTERILLLARWMPFFRFTSWDAYDPDLDHQVEQVDEVRRVAQFSLPAGDGSDYQPLQLQRLRSDFGRDRDGNGLFEELVIELELEALYEGPVYIQAGLNGLPYPLFVETSTVRGKNRLEFVVDAQYLLELGEDGPYHFVDFQLTNQNPGCNEPPCTMAGSLPFTIYMEPYFSKSYQLTAFEGYSTSRTR